MALQALVVDDEPQVRRFVSQVLEEDGWEVTEANSAEQVFEMMFTRDWAVVFCDVVLGGADGFTVLRRFKEQLFRTQVVLMTGHGSAAGALDATAFGAYDYLLKPFTVEDLQSLSRAVSEQLVRRPAMARIFPRTVAGNYNSDLDLIGRSAAFIEVMKIVGRVAGTNLPVLLTGESGTGKEVVASALHSRSKRSGKPFVALNCGAIPSELIESELFGHLRGAFTGADRDRIGLWEQADGGTVFLDEVTETSAAFQVKLLRVLQEGEIRRLGSSATQKVDVRVIAASNKDVESEVKADKFRQDLFYRLNAVSIMLPPLRERREDILPLAQRFAEQVYSLNTAARFSREALDLLEQYDWPGNIRELENAVVRAVVMSEGLIRPQDLPQHVRSYSDKTSVSVEAADVREEEESLVPLSDIEARYVKRVLTHTHGNKQAAARLLGIDRKTLTRMIKRHNIQVPNVGQLPSRAA
jgi:two-component system, NtrC family, response regulator AtoC